VRYGWAGSWLCLSPASKWMAGTRSLRRNPITQKGERNMTSRVD